MWQEASIITTCLKKLFTEHLYLGTVLNELLAHLEAFLPTPPKGKWPS